jgi:hypothetical protein
LNHKLDPHPIIELDNLSKICSLWSLVPKEGEMLFTKIELKGGEAQRRRNNKREGSTKILSTQVGGASS